MISSSLRAQRSNPATVLDCFVACGSSQRRPAGCERVQPAIYIMASKRNGTLYTGVTSNLPQRAWQHREGIADGFTSRYGCKALVWFEIAETMEAAITREKQIKGGSRGRKLALIETLNPGWDDLYTGIAHG